MSKDTTDPAPWRRPAIYYGRRYIPGYTSERTLLDVSTGKNVVHFNTYDVSESNRSRSVFSATPKITNLYLYEASSGNIPTQDSITGLIPMSGIQLEVWGYNFGDLPIARAYLNTLYVYVSGSEGVFDSREYVTVDRYTTMPTLSARNPAFRGIPVDFKLIPVLDRRKSITQKNPRTLYYTRRNKLQFNLPGIHANEGCVDIIVANAAGYTTLNTLTNELICN